MLLSEAFLLLDFARTFLAIALACQRFLRAALFSRFQVKRVPLDFFHDIFLLDFAFETAKSAFECFAVLQMDFCQLKIHHLPEIPEMQGCSPDNRFIVS